MTGPHSPHERSTGYLPDASVDELPEPEPATSKFEDLVDIFYAPSRVFARRAGSSWWFPLLVLTLLIGGITYAQTGAMQPIMDAEFNRGMEQAMKQNPQLTPEMMQMSRTIGEKFAQVAGFVVVPIAVLLVGIFLWLAGKLFGSTQTVGAALMVAAYAYLPRVLESVVNGVQLLVLDPADLNGRYRLSLGVGRFLDPDTASPALLGLVGRVDVFTLWITVLLAIGLSVTGRIPKSKAAMAAALVWLLGAMPALLQAARS